MKHWVTKKKKLLIHITILIDLKEIKKKNQSQKVTYCVVPLYSTVF